MRLNVCFNEMALFGPFAALSRAIAVMAEMEASPQGGMANSQGMKVFAVERPGLPEDYVSFPALRGVELSPLVLCRIGRLSGVRCNSGRHRERLCAWGLRSPELSARVRQANSCISCIPAHMDASITRTGRNN